MSIARRGRADVEKTTEPPDSFCPICGSPTCSRHPRPKRARASQDCNGRGRLALSAAANNLIAEAFRFLQYKLSLPAVYRPGNRYIYLWRSIVRFCLKVLYYPVTLLNNGCLRMAIRKCEHNGIHAEWKNATTPVERTFSIAKDSQSEVRCIYSDSNGRPARVRNRQVWLHITRVCGIGPPSRDQSLATHSSNGCHIPRIPTLRHIAADDSPATRPPERLVPRSDPAWMSENGKG